MRRRQALAVIAAGVGSLAGCSRQSTADGGDGDRSGTPGEPSPSPSGSPTPTEAASTPTDTAAEASLGLAPVDPPTGGATIVVYPTDLQSWLREAASSGSTLRVHARAPVVMPEPPLPAFDRVRLRDPTGEVDGWYDVEGEAGIRYHYLAGATETTPPDGEQVTPVGDLPEARRRLAMAAIRGETGDEARFYPETKLGEWARTEFFGGYLRHDGTVYQGMEVQQTDAAFFSRDCWYVLALDPVGDGTGPTLSLADIDDEIRGTVDGMLDDRGPEESVTRSVSEVSRSVVEFFGDTGYLLTHSAVFAATVE